jgi:hypothetical protein
MFLERRQRARSRAPGGLNKRLCSRDEATRGSSSGTPSSARTLCLPGHSVLHRSLQTYGNAGARTGRRDEPGPTSIHNHCRLIIIDCLSDHVRVSHHPMSDRDAHPRARTFPRSVQWISSIYSWRPQCQPPAGAKSGRTTSPEPFSEHIPLPFVHRRLRQRSHPRISRLHPRHPLQPSPASATPSIPRPAAADAMSFPKKPWGRGRRGMKGWGKTF